MHTSFSEHVILVGNSKSLGNWDPQKGLKLSTSAVNYPQWFNLYPLKFFKGTNLEFKFLVMRNDEVIRWETLPSKENRRYVIRKEKAVLKCFEGKYEGEEILHKNSLAKKKRSRLFSQEKIKKEEIEGLSSNSEVFFNKNFN